MDDNNIVFKNYGEVVDIIEGLGVPETLVSCLELLINQICIVEQIYYSETSEHADHSVFACILDLVMRQNEYRKLFALMVSIDRKHFNRKNEILRRLLELIYYVVLVIKTFASTLRTSFYSVVKFTVRQLFVYSCEELIRFLYSNDNRVKFVVFLILSELVEYGGFEIRDFLVSMCYEDIGIEEILQGKGMIFDNRSFSGNYKFKTIRDSFIKFIFSIFKSSDSELIFFYLKERRNVLNEIFKLSCEALSPDTVIYIIKIWREDFFRNKNIRKKIKIMFVSKMFSVFVVKLLSIEEVSDIVCDFIRKLVSDGQYLSFSITSPENINVRGEMTIYKEHMLRNNVLFTLIHELNPEKDAGRSKLLMHALKNNMHLIPAYINAIVIPGLSNISNLFGEFSLVFIFLSLYRMRVMSGNFVWDKDVMDFIFFPNNLSRLNLSKKIQSERIFTRFLYSLIILEILRKIHKERYILELEGNSNKIYLQEWIDKHLIGYLPLHDTFILLLTQVKALSVREPFSNGTIQFPVDERNRLYILYMLVLKIFYHYYSIFENFVVLKNVNIVKTFNVNAIIRSYRLFIHQEDGRYNHSGFILIKLILRLCMFDSNPEHIINFCTRRYEEHMDAEFVYNLFIFYLQVISNKGTDPGLIGLENGSVALIEHIFTTLNIFGDNISTFVLLKSMKDIIRGMSKSEDKDTFIDVLARSVVKAMKNISLNEISNEELFKTIQKLGDKDGGNLFLVTFVEAIRSSPFAMELLEYIEKFIRYLLFSFRELGDGNSLDLIRSLDPDCCLGNNDQLTIFTNKDNRRIIRKKASEVDSETSYSHGLSENQSPMDMKEMSQSQEDERFERKLVKRMEEFMVSRLDENILKKLSKLLGKKLGKKEKHVGGEDDMVEFCRNICYFYTYTLCYKDRLIFRLLRQLEFRYSKLNLRDMILSRFAGDGNDAEYDIFGIISSLDQQKMQNTIKLFPRDQKSLQVLDNQTLEERMKHRKSSQSIYDMEYIYDPTFLLILIHFILEEIVEIKEKLCTLLRLFVSRHLLSIVICGMSADNKVFRTASFSLMSIYYETLYRTPNSIGFAEKNIVLYVLDSLRFSMSVKNVSPERPEMDPISPMLAKVTSSVLTTVLKKDHLYRIFSQYLIENWSLSLSTFPVKEIFFLEEDEQGSTKVWLTGMMKNSFLIENLDQNYSVIKASTDLVDNISGLKLSKSTDTSQVEFIKEHVNTILGYSLNIVNKFSGDYLKYFHPLNHKLILVSCELVYVLLYSEKCLRWLVFDFDILDWFIMLILAIRFKWVPLLLSQFISSYKKEVAKVMLIANIVRNSSNIIESMTSKESCSRTNPSLLILRSHLSSLDTIINSKPW